MSLGPGSWRLAFHQFKIMESEVRATRSRGLDMDRILNHIFQHRASSRQAGRVRSRSPFAEMEQ
eukprot:6375938-Karenia_brevis.AAC.1